MFENTTKNFAIAAFSAVGGCILLIACMFAVSTNRIDSLDGIGFIVCLLVAVTVAASDADRYFGEVSKEHRIQQ